MNYNFDEYIERRGTDSFKWDGLRTGGQPADEKVIPMGLADMDFLCAPQIVEAIRKRTDQGIFGYGLGNTDEYQNAVCSWFKRRFDWDVDPEHIVFSPGVVPALGFLIELLTKSGEGIIVQKPVYHFFFHFTESHGRKLVNNALINRGGRYEMDFEDLEKKAADPDTKLLILCSPHNPAGRVWKEEELSRLVHICMDNGVIIISDEIHNDLIRREEKHIPLAKLFPEYKDRIITCTAPTKTFNLAGIQLSNILIHDDKLRNSWGELVMGQYGIYGAPVLSYPAAIAALNQGEEWLEQLLDYIDGNIRFTHEFFSEQLPSAIMSPTEGTYLVWVDLKAWGYSHKELRTLIQNEARVFAGMGDDYGDEGRGFIRLNVACPRVLLEEGLRRISWVLENLRPGEKAPEELYRTPWIKERVPIGFRI